MFDWLYSRCALSVGNIPMIFTMGVAFFVIHGNDPFSLKELAFVYLVIFILMYIAGPGKFSLDRLIAVLLSQKR